MKSAEPIDLLQSRPDFVAQLHTARRQASMTEDAADFPFGRATVLQTMVHLQYDFAAAAGIPERCYTPIVSGDRSIYMAEP